jgi:hypothetical protein
MDLFLNMALQLDINNQHLRAFMVSFLKVVALTTPQEFTQLINLVIKQMPMLSKIEQSSVI